MNALKPSILLLALLLSVTPAQAQTTYAATHITASCDGPQVQLTVSMDLYDALPADVVGWVVERTIWGACNSSSTDVDVVRPFESGLNEYQLVDAPEFPDLMTRYQAYAVDSGGNRIGIRWYQRKMYAEAACRGGAAYRGIVREIGPGYYTLEPCPDECWPFLSNIDNSIPDDMPVAGLVGQAVELIGTTFPGLEGLVIDADSWQVLPGGCSNVVGAHEASWGSLKSPYR